MARISFTGDYCLAPALIDLRYVENTDLSTLLIALNAGFVVNTGLAGAVRQTVNVVEPCHMNCATLGEACTGQREGQPVMRWLRGSKAASFCDVSATRPADWLFDTPIYECYAAADGSIEHVRSSYAITNPSSWRVSAKLHAPDTAVS